MSFVIDFGNSYTKVGTTQSDHVTLLPSLYGYQRL
jgi:hypothetical protein